MEEVESLFIRSFGADTGLEGTVCVAAPGRVNLIGEHTDYQDGFVMPFAIDFKTIIIARKNDLNGTCRVVSAQQNNSVETFETEHLSPGESKWFKYVQGVVSGYMKDIDGVVSFDAALSSTVPQGGGLSSSASLEVATATMLEALYNVKNVSATEKALRCVEAEHVYAKVPCGIMDQYASAKCTEGHALLIDCRTKTCEEVPVDDPSIAFVVTNSNAPHELTGSEYPNRVKQCKAAADALAKKFPDKNIKKLRDATLEDIETCKEEMDPIVYKRGLHVITENERVAKAYEASKKNDLAKFGALMTVAHASLRDNFEVSTPELDLLVEIATKCEGVYGSRMTGGGFGGCTITLVKKEFADALIKTLEEEYKNKTGGKDCTCFLTNASKGAHVVWTDGKPSK